MDFTKSDVGKTINSFLLEHSYSDTIYNQSIVILGPVPPPLGGISVHIKRVSKKLLKQNNKVHHFDTIQCLFRYPFCLMHLFCFLVMKKPTQVHYHTLYGHGLLELRVVLLAKKLLTFTLKIIDHDCRYLYTKDDIFKNKYQKNLQAIEQLILIGNTTLKSYSDNGISIPKNTSIESAFLPPNTDEENSIISTYPSSLLMFLSKAHPKILVNAFQLHLLDNEDLYGIDLAITALEAIKQKFSQAALIIVLSNIGNEAYYHYLIALIKEKKLSDNCFFLIGQRELWPLLKKIDLFLRPTRSDSFGISVAEACYFKVPTIASDCCIRPRGSILFKTGDQADLNLKIMQVLQGHRAGLTQ